MHPALPAVALYPLSSPNHNFVSTLDVTSIVALYPLSSPNHNTSHKEPQSCGLRYILFHHQTTTNVMLGTTRTSCVISSFITKPQQAASHILHLACCVISSFITKPQRISEVFGSGVCCVISSFITKPQPVVDMVTDLDVALYPLSSPNHNFSTISI